MPLVNSCCYCCTTRTGCLIIGILDLIGSLVTIAGTAQSLASWETMSNQLRKTEVPNVDIEGFLYVLRVDLIIILVTCLMHLVAASMLIHGVRKMIPGFLMPFILLTIINIIMHAVMNAAILYTLRGGAAVPIMSATITGIALGMYLTMVVFSHFQELQDK